MSEAHAKEQKKAGMCLRATISSIRYLVRSGNAVRGHESDTGNLVMLLQERTSDIEELELWLKKRDKYLSPEIQNEIIEIMAHKIMHEIVAEIKNAPWFSVIADGTTDCAGQEQFSVCVRFVHPQTLVVKEVFVGLYNPHDSKGATLAGAIQDVLLRMNLPISDLRGHCFDGASNMSGREKGVQKILDSVQPKSLYVHCSNHALDLALQEVARQRSGMCDLLCTVKDVSNVILDSAKRRTIYADIVLPPCKSGAGDEDVVTAKPSQLLALCPTRWSVRVNSLKRFEKEYKRVQRTLEAINEEKGAISDERKSAIRGWMARLRKFETLFFLNVSIEVFSPCEELARALQNSSITASGAKHSALLVIRKLEELRTVTNFNRIYEHTNETAEELELDNPMEPRQKKVPQRFEYASKAEPSSKIKAKDNLRLEYYQIIDLLMNKLSARFEQSGLKQLCELEKLIMDSLQGNVPTYVELNTKLSVFAEDFNLDSLHTQLQLLKNLPGNVPDTCVAFAKKLGNESHTALALLDQVTRLVILIMTVPASSASAERSFSTLRRLKTYLRSTMTQRRLTHLTLLHIHNDRTASIDITSVMKEFVSRNNERKRVFGKV